MKILIFFLALFICGISFSQTSKIATDPITSYTNFDLYNVSYVLKDYILNDDDKSLINSINLTPYEGLRKMNDDVEVFDPTMQKIIVLFSKNKTVSNMESFIFNN